MSSRRGRIPAGGPQAAAAKLRPSSRLAFDGRGARRVAEHAAGADRADAVRAQFRHDLRPAAGCRRARLAPAGPAPAPGPAGARSRSGPRAGRRTGHGQARVPRVAGTALGAKRANRRGDRGRVAAVPVDHQHRRPVQAGVAAELDQQERSAPRSRSTACRGTPRARRWRRCHRRTPGPRPGGRRRRAPRPPPRSGCRCPSAGAVRAAPATRAAPPAAAAARRPPRATAVRRGALFPVRACRPLWHRVPRRLAGRGVGVRASAVTPGSRPCAGGASRPDCDASPLMRNMHHNC